MNRPAGFEILNDAAEKVAPRLLGSVFIAVVDGATIRLKIVETEAYDQSDAASHSYKGRTMRTDVMFGPAGHLYVYFTYGMHYCCNVVVGEAGRGTGVLIRAAEPLGDTSRLTVRRLGRTGRELTNGPAKLCQALGITTAMNGHDLSQPPLMLQIESPVPVGKIITTTRIGIRHEREKPWRFYIKDNPFVSVIDRRAERSQEAVSGSQVYS